MLPADAKLDTFTFTRRGRSFRAGVILIFWYAVLFALILFADAAWWLMGLLALPTLPALWDLASDPASGVQLGPDQLVWHSGRRQGALDLAEIGHMRFDTRWDFSVRVTAVLNNKKRVRLPSEAVPPHRQFEQAFSHHGIDVQRHHFTIF